MYFVETSIFTKRIREVLSDDEYRMLQMKLVIHPDAGDIIKHSGGIRKLRWAGSGRGKRGGIRVIYFYYSEPDRIILLYVYPKNETEDLTSKQIKFLKSLIEED